MKNFLRTATLALVAFILIACSSGRTVFFRDISFVVNSEKWVEHEKNESHQTFKRNDSILHVAMTDASLLDFSNAEDRDIFVKTFAFRYGSVANEKPITVNNAPAYQYDISGNNGITDYAGKITMFTLNDRFYFIMIAAPKTLSGEDISSYETVLNSMKIGKQ